MIPAFIPQVGNLRRRSWSVFSGIINTVNRFVPIMFLFYVSLNGCQPLRWENIEKVAG
jgi:hypothetical protein